MLLDELGKHKKIGIAASGGMDSTTLLYDALTQFGPNRVVPLHAVFGKFTEAAERELLTEIEETTGCKVVHVYVPLGREIRKDRSASLFTGVVYDGPKPSSLREYLKKERQYVSGIYTVVWSHLVAAAMNRHCGVVAFGFHAEESHPDYPFRNSVEDCSEGFINALDHFRAVIWGIGAPRLVAPYSVMTKTGVYAHGVSLGLKETLAKTLSCYAGAPCGRCFECYLRKEAERAISVRSPR